MSKNDMNRDVEAEQLHLRRSLRDKLIVSNRRDLGISATGVEMSQQKTVGHMCPFG